MADYDSVAVSLFTFWILVIVLMLAFSQNIINGDADLKSKIDPNNQGLDWGDRFEFLWQIVSFQVTGVATFLAIFIDLSSFFLFTYVIIRIARGS